ncbi:translocation/assembly module TamB domain-containing protein [Simplicispira psychrophila]|uniref:translocation/assembly module TamB domain-containing protein n=1 Tax=Simplicispira psychrophila TaxID=80882 RepID=UPI0004873459|nr:translocation/assembly module TamB domain-containing protein [Simplicispira psychrophila]
MATRKPTPPDAGADTFAAAAGGPPTPNPYAAASARHPGAPVRRRARFWRLAAGLLALLVLAVLLLAAGTWVWSGRSTSLATTLAQVARWLPADQELKTRDVSGSLRGGGHIGWLRWSSPTLAVEVQDTRIAWSLAPLLQRSVKLGEVHAAHVRVAATPDPNAPKPAPLQSLVLPVRIDLPFQIDLIEWVGPPVVEARALKGHYQYDRVQHTLAVDGVDLAQGHYSANATLQAQAPMALQATLEGQVRTVTPGNDQPLLLSAHATVNGTLATEAARLQVLAQLRPPTTDAADKTAAEKDIQDKAATKPPTKAAAAHGAPPPVPANTMQADVRAEIAPWAPQPLLQASAALRALNLAALWPQAPTTALEGSVQAGPQGSGWQVAAQLRNDLPGPWDQGRLPVSGLDAQADYDGAQWRIPQAEVRVGNGRITAQGTYTVASSAIEGSAAVQALNPAALHTRLDAAPVNGQLRAQRQDGAVRFNADLRASGRAAPVRTPSGKAGKAPALRIQSVRASGHWNAPLLTLQQLEVDALQAQLRGQKIAITLGNALAVSGNLTLTVPGATARTTGQLEQANGAGELQLNVASAERVQAWLQSLPGLSTALQGPVLQGQARLDARWRGGLRSLQQQLQSASGTAPVAAAATVRGDTPFTLQATLTAPSLDIALPPAKGSTAATHLQLSRLNAALSGSLAQATLALDGQVQQGQQRITLNTHISGGLATSGNTAAQWRANVAALQLQLQDAARPGAWALRLQKPLVVTLRQTSGAKGNAGSTVVETGAGQARLSGPAPGNVALTWQPLRLVQSAQGAVQLQTQGELTGLPLAWVDALSAADAESPLAAMGLAGNLVFNGRWDVDAGDTLRASAVLERASGDLRLLNGEAAPVTTVRSSGSQPKVTATTATSSAAAPASGTPVGVRQARLQLNADGSQVSARLQWDSERAGQIEANASSTLTRQDGGWSWSPDTPLNARARARLPDVGVWSALAPPGWRIHGTLDADATLSGSLNAPQWQGTLGADRITVQSLLDGVDLKDGRLRAVLRGNQLDITELSLQGGQGSQARIAGYSGNLTPSPRDGGSLQGSGTLRWNKGTGTSTGSEAPPPSGSGIALDFTAQLRALQVLVRADRQASVSGTLRAGLKDGQITVRGDLTVDRATILLPEASAPKLGDDVVVRSAAIDRANAAKAQQASKSAARVQTAKAPDIAVTLNLGRDFALQGAGITTRLEGALEVRGGNSPGAPPRITGEVRTVQGRYRAWGQSLDVETGIARFNGPYNNPSLDILAIRPNISVRAGVQVTGSAQAPRVRLYSDPDLPDAEKLSWVVVGRSTAAGGAEAVLLQQAALALLGGQGGGTGSMAQRLGVDEIGFKGPGSANDASGAAITLGKRLSSKLYVTYEQSLSGAMGAIYIFYDLSKRLTLRGQTGTQSAVDIIYTVEKD